VELREVIKRPIVTEKSTRLIKEENKYTFAVSRKANKTEIKEAVELLFGVTVLKVNTMQVRGKLKRMGRTEGYTSSWKKAVVALAPGDRIDIL